MVGGPSVLPPKQKEEPPMKGGVTYTPTVTKDEPVMMMKGGVPNPSVAKKEPAVKVNEKGAKEITVAEVGAKEPEKGAQPKKATVFCATVKDVNNVTSTMQELEKQRKEYNENI